jgi:hypothetical protein
MEAEVPDDGIRSLLGVVFSAWRVRLLDARGLPDIAAELIAAGLDSPSLVELAGLDFAPFDPRDASDLLVAVFEELELPPPDLVDALKTATLIVAWAVEAGRLLPPYAAAWASRTFMTADCPDKPPELARLFSLDEEYYAVDHGHWHRCVEEIDDDARAVVRSLLANSDVPRWTAEPLGAQVIELILPGV